MPLTISGNLANSTAVGLFLSLPSKLADRCHALCSEKVGSLVSNALLDGVVLKPRAKHAEHIRSRDDGDVRSGCGKIEMLRRADIAVFARLGGSMVGMSFLREAGLDVS